MIDGMPTYWGGQPAKAKRVNVLVGHNPDVPDDHYFNTTLKGKWRAAIEVETEDGPVYIDDEEIPNHGFMAVTAGQGQVWDMQFLVAEKVKGRRKPTAPRSKPDEAV